MATRIPVPRSSAPNGRRPVRRRPATRVLGPGASPGTRAPSGLPRLLRAVAGRAPRVALPALLALASAGCVSIATPLDTNVEETTLGTKVGRARWQAVLGLVAWGDAGVHAAAEDGGIRVVRHLDQETLAVGFFLYFRQTTVAYGD